MNTPRTFGSQPRKVGTSQRRAPSPLTKGGRHSHSGTKRKRIVRRDEAAGLKDPEAINAPDAPSADVGTAGPSGDREDVDPKPAGLSHPKRSLKGKEITRYDVRQRPQVRGEFFEASKVAGEQLAAMNPLSRPTAKQRSLSLPKLKDKKMVLDNIRDSETQALPVERDTEKATYVHPPAGKPRAPTWKGEVVSKSNLRRMKAKPRIKELKQGRCEGHDVITHPANSSAQHPSQLVTRLHHSNQNKTNAQPTPPLYPLENLPRTHREHSKNMSNLRGVPPSGRGRNSGRISRNQQSPDEFEPSFQISPNTSTGGARRPRGFQPTEVNIASHDLGSADKTSFAHTSTHVGEPAAIRISTDTSAIEQSKKSTRARTPPEGPAAYSELQHHSDTAAPREPVSSIKAVATKAVEPKPDPVNITSLSKLGENTSSSIQLTNLEETRERKTSFWSKVMDHPERSTPGWDDGTQDLSQPSWKLRDAIHSTQDRAPKRANMANLPPYKFPRKKPQNPAAESFNRQMAGMEKVPVQHLPEGSNSLNTGTISATRYNSPNDATHSTKNSSPKVITHTTKNTASEQGLTDSRTEKAPQPIEVMSTTVPPHLRGLSHHSQARDFTTEKPNPPNAADKQLAPHLTTSVDSLKITDPQAIDSEQDQAGKATIAAMLNYEVPPHLQVPPFHTNRRIEKSKAMTLSSDHLENNGTKPNVNIDEEVAAGLNAIDHAIDHDEELAAALQAEWSGDKESTHQNQYDDFELTNHQAQILHTEKSVGAKNSNQTQNNTFGATDHQENRGEALPPHLRVLVTSRSTTQAIGKTSNIQAKPVSAQQSGPEPTTLVGTQSNGLKNITNDRPIEQVHTADGGAFATTAKSAVKEGKKPARNDDFLPDNSGLANWDGKLAPPLQGEDWHTREPFDSSNRDRNSIIEAWREEQATEAEVTGGVKIDTKSLGFQTGNGLIGGNGDVLSFIDDADHEAIPNDDDFTQVHREQNSAGAIEQFKAQTASRRKSTKSGESNGTRRPERRERKRGLRDQDEDYVLPLREHAPEANIYLRPAESGDMRQCTNIYNQWALDTSFTVMSKPVDQAYWTECYNNSQDDGTPFLVAVHMGQKRCNELKDVRRKKGETIVGFSVATNYGSKDSVYRYSVELELYVHREHLRQGIGRTMLDRMLAALCQDYGLLECAPLLLSKEHHLHAWMGGGVPIVHTVAINLLHWAEEDKENVEWKMKWLSGGRNNFEHAGTIPRIGFKFRKPMNNCLMVRDSGSVITPH